MAEGVESAEQAERLREMGCEAAQGSYTVWHPSRRLLCPEEAFAGAFASLIGED